MSSRAPFSFIARSTRLLRAAESPPHTIPMGHQKNRQSPTEKKTEGTPLTIIVAGMALIGGYVAWSKWKTDPDVRHKNETPNPLKQPPSTPPAAPRAKD
ncbi:hypothetical protein BGW42_006395 [Actinomortierella wolfii]|nr:hypothetical protein BGW42_006395 [Actinomortierella wolfii]